MGRRGGAYVDVHPVDLLSAVLRDLFDRTGLDAALVDDHIAGCVSQVGDQSLNVARNAWLAAGLPEIVPSTTVDRQCGSSQQAIHFAAQGIMAGANDLVVASGLEHMTRVPLGSSMSSGNPFPPSLSVRYEGKLVPQGISAELIASRWQISREEQDDFGYRSHEWAARATREGWFREHLVLVKPGGGGESLDRDEGVRMEPDRDRMRSLEPAFRSSAFEEMFPGRLGWTVTAGNSSQISDAAAAVLVASAERAEELGLRPRARLVSFAVVGDDPVLMLTGPIPATRMVLDRAGLEAGARDPGGLVRRAREPQRRRHRHGSSGGGERRQAHGRPGRRAGAARGPVRAPGHVRRRGDGQRDGPGAYPVSWWVVLTAILMGLAIAWVGVIALRAASGPGPRESPEVEDVEELEVFLVCRECGTEFRVTRLGELQIPRHCGEPMEVVRRPAAGELTPG